MRSRHLYQQIRVHRGHHHIDGDPDLSTVGPTWSGSRAAADVYARHASIKGMKPEFPVVSSRTYNTVMPAVFDSERISADVTLPIYGFEDDEIKLVKERFGDTPSVWQMANDPEVQQMFKDKGADALVYPETFTSRELTRFDDGMIDDDNQFYTFRPLGAEYSGETDQMFVGEPTQVAGMMGKVVRNLMGTNKNFQSLAARTKAVDEEGMPAVVFHGTTHDIQKFDPDKVQELNDWGKGFYFSNSAKDAQHNYMGRDYMPEQGMTTRGPDLEYRIEMEAERTAEKLLSEGKVDTWEEGYNIGRQYATRTLAGANPNVMPVVLDMRNPITIDRPGAGTEFNDEMVEEFMDALYVSLEDMDNDLPEEIMQNIEASLMDHVVDYDTISAYDLGKKLTTHLNGRVYNEVGDSVEREAIRRAWEHMGYDGIIDKSVPLKFDTMEGVDEDTIHYIIFDNKRIKSLPGNRGGFDPASEDPTASIFTGQEYQTAGLLTKMKGVLDEGLDLAPGFNIGDYDKLVRTDFIYGPGKPAAPKNSIYGPRLRHQLQLDALKVFGGKPMEYNDENLPIVANNLYQEVVSALPHRPDAVGWYKQNLNEAFQHIHKIHPEIATDPDMDAAFRMGLAITSNGLRVPKNADIANKVYEYYKTNGRFPENEKWVRVGTASNQIQGAFKTANDLLDELNGDWNAVRDFLMTERPVRDWEAAGFQISGELKDTMLPGSVIFGPKIGGGFMQNLMGNFEPPTFDRWWQRTWGRHTGSLFKTEEQIGQARQKFLDAMTGESKRISRLGYSIKELRKQPTTHEEQLKLDQDLSDLAYLIYNEYSKDWSKKTALNNAARSYTQQGIADVKDPRNGTERNYMRRAVREVQRMLRENDGIDIDPADIQALLWYVEKDLTEKLGGISDYERPDYATAFKKIAKQHGK